MAGSVRKYSSMMIAVHWLTVILVAVAYLVSEGGPRIRAHPPVLHFALGLAVLVLVLPRLLARLFGGAPPMTDGSPWLLRAAQAGHALLYLMLIAVPIAGWYTASLMGVPVTVLGVTLPALTAAVPGRPGPLGELHQLGGNALVILAGLHALVALWHHFVRHDDTLNRMRPF